MLCRQLASGSHASISNSHCYLKIQLAAEFSCRKNPALRQRSIRISAIGKLVKGVRRRTCCSEHLTIRHFYRRSWSSSFLHANRCKPQGHQVSAVTADAKWVGGLPGKDLPMDVTWHVFQVGFHLVVTQQDTNLSASQSGRLRRPFLGPLSQKH